MSKVQSARAALQADPSEDPLENEEQLVDQLDSASPLCRSVLPPLHSSSLLLLYSSLPPPSSHPLLPPFSLLPTPSSLLPHNSSLFPCPAIALVADCALPIISCSLESSDVFWCACPCLASCRYQYDKMADFLLSMFDPLVNQLQALAGAGTAQPNQIEILEGELAWLLYIVGAVVGARGSSRSSEEHELLDGDLCAKVFQTISWIEIRQQQPQGASSATVQRLELALLYVFQYFRKAYIGEQSNVSSTNLYARLGERVGISDQVTVMDVIMNKTMSNLKVWCRHGEIVEKSLNLFSELASGYSSSKTLLKLNVIVLALQHHGPEQLPFLSLSGNPRNRTNFYMTLTRILLMDDNGLMDFEAYMAPFVPVLQHLAAFFSGSLPGGTEGAARDQAKQLVMGVLRDLRGVCIGMANRRAYTLFFDWLYPDYLPMLAKAAEVWAYDHEVTTPLLKFYSELVHNKCQRISFECSSPNGILLFREASTLLVTYGRRILAGGHLSTTRWRPLVLLPSCVCMRWCACVLLQMYC